MGNRKKREPGPQQHAEGQHGEKTHRRFIEQLYVSRTEPAATDDAEHGARDGRRRLHEDRQQHDPAEKNAEKVQEHREIERGHTGDEALARAHVPHEGDAR